MNGQTLGRYRVDEQLGRGGMGEVYAADDLSLDRKVALKFLPDAFTCDPERMARFEREAKVLASLNHPNIAAIYGLEEAEGKRFIVMELVQGETLEQRLRKEPLPIDECVAICRQIAEALEAAHEKGVIHRDLKPANVMVSEGDKVKILDFGLAKALSSETQSVDASQSPTFTESMTRPGVILGTAAYMSPEQSKGKAVDKRSDIWAFGCILYECLTGKRAFEGETVTETLAAILKSEPDWNALPATTPQNIRSVLHRCLQKETGRRFHHAADMRIDIEETPRVPEVPPPVNHRWPWAAWGVAALLAVALSVSLWAPWRSRRPAAEPVRFQFGLPDKVSFDSTGGMEISPDGRHLIFVAAGPDGISRIWIRSLQSLEVRPLSGTESAESIPFWSPDSQFIAFCAAGKLKRVDVAGGPPLVLCSCGPSGGTVGGAWNREGIIIFGNTTTGLMRVSAAGGVASPVTKLNMERQENRHIHPSFLRDGRHFLYFCGSNIPENEGVYIGSLAAKPEEQSVKRLMATSWAAVYVSSGDSTPGHLLFPREQTLMAQLFDDKRLEPIGSPIPVAEQLGYFINYGFFSASLNGVLAYRGGSINISQQTWFDRHGKILGAAGEKGRFGGLALSRDGRLAAMSVDSSSQASPSPHIYLLNLARGTNTRFTFGTGANWELYPIWSPDGNRVVFAKDPETGVDDLYQKFASGIRDEELLLKSNEDKYPTSWSSDGRFLLYTSSDPKLGTGDLWLLQMDKGAKARLLVSTKANECDGRFSPDMRWIAYVSDETGRGEVYVREFSQASGAPLETGGKWQISRTGGSEPRWRGDSQELYYRTTDGGVMAVEIMPGASFEAGTPQRLFQTLPDFSRVTPAINSTWDVSSDGKRFLLPAPDQESSRSPFTIILNWTSLLKK